MLTLLQLDIYIYIYKKKNELDCFITKAFGNAIFGTYT